MVYFQLKSQRIFQRFLLHSAGILKGIVISFIFCCTGTGLAAYGQGIHELPPSISTSHLSCVAEMVPDLPLIDSNSTLEAEIDLVINRFSDAYLGTSAPTGSELDTALTQYNRLGITVVGDAISGHSIASFADLSFLKVFVQHLKFNPSDAEISEKANHVVWLAGQQVCDGVLTLNVYAFRDFSKSAVFLQTHLAPQAESLFEYTLFKAAGEYAHFWVPLYDDAYQTTHGAINTDIIYTIADVMMAMTRWQDSPAQQLQYMSGFKRYLERFASHSSGTADGLKPDGSGFHHWTAYNGYMYAYRSFADILWYLQDTSFQISTESYDVFRKAVYYQYMQSNDAGLQPFATSGRNPHGRNRPINATALKRTALVGGTILGEEAADPLLAQLYNRVYGVDAAFSTFGSADFADGFTQYNHASGAGYRKNGWLAFSKGFSNNMWGSEIYESRNRFGRYQSYGALEIIYAGDKGENGYDVETWDWNLNPGTTVIHLPWSMLHAERGRIDELQQKRFVGALAFDRAGFSDSPLSDTTGSAGMFAIDFQENGGPSGWGTIHTSDNNHNGTFKFQKSAFFFDDMIVNLASGITNDDSVHSTITTLFQRLDNKPTSSMVANGQILSLAEDTFDLSEADDQWLINHYGTGFLVVAGDHTITLKHSIQQTPNHTQIATDDFSSNASAAYFVGYLDHGTAPSNKQYEYVIKPDTDSVTMAALMDDIDDGRKPYTVHQRDEQVHIVEYVRNQTWGYAVFEPISDTVHSYVRAVDAPSLLMHRYDAATSRLLLTIANPDLGFSSRSYTPSVPLSVTVTLNGQWVLPTRSPTVEIVATDALSTVIRFELTDGLPTEVLLMPPTVSHVQVSDQQIVRPNLILLPIATVLFLTILFLCVGSKRNLP